jgi:hypothetical protein
MKRQDGYLTRKSGSWLGHYSKWITDSSTGQRMRRDGFSIGRRAELGGDHRAKRHGLPISGWV